MVKEEVTGIILSGGKSSRLGEEKGLALFNGKALIQYSIDTLKPVCDKIIISANNQLDEYDTFGYEIVEDQVKGIGPMAGLMAGLMKSDTRYNFVLSCDTPFVQSALFPFMLEKIENFQAAIPVHGKNHFEPLCAVYATNVIWHLQQFIEEGKYKLKDFLTEVSAKKVLIHNQLSFFSEEMFVNMNTHKDIQNKTANG